MPSILYLSINDWVGMRQRPKHFAELLSSDYFVIYFCQMTWNRHAYKGYDQNEKKLRKIIQKNLIVFRVKLIPLNRIPLINIINMIPKRLMIHSLIRKYNPDYIWATLPEQYRFIPKNYKGHVIYDCMDNHAQFNNDKRIDEYEKKLVKKAELILTSSNELFKKISQIDSNKRIEVVKNGTEFYNFYNYYKNISYKIKPPEFVEGKKTIGYFGAVQTWFDIDLLVYCASHLKECIFIIIGPVENSQAIEKTKDYTNIIFTGSKKYEDLPAYLYYFDVCIMPFIVNDLIKSVNPVKVYEYLSMGKPVIMPDYVEVREFSKYAYLAPDNEKFLEYIIRSLNENNEFIIKERIEFAKNNTWQARVDQSKILLKELL